MSRRSSAKIRNISAVQRPMPGSASSISIADSSSSFLSLAKSSRPFAFASASARSHFAFAFDSPQLRSASGSAARKWSGLNCRAAPVSAATRAWMVSAALIDSCWPMIELHST